MGTTIHHTVVVSCFSKEKAEKARQKAIEIYKDHNSVHDGDTSRIISEVVRGLRNDISSFFIAPDGSKEGWDASNYSDVARNKFVEYMLNDADQLYCDFVVVEFGGDVSPDANVLKTNY